MKINVSTDEIHNIFNSILSTETRKQDNYYIKIMTIKARSFLLENKLFEDESEFKIVLSKIKQPYFNDYKKFVWKDTKTKMTANNYIFVGAKGNTINFYGYLKNEELLEIAQPQKKGFYSVKVKDLKSVSK